MKHGNEKPAMAGSDRTANEFPHTTHTVPRDSPKYLLGKVAYARSPRRVTSQRSGARSGRSALGLRRARSTLLSFVSLRQEPVQSRRLGTTTSTFLTAWPSETACCFATTTTNHDPVWPRGLPAVHCHHLHTFAVTVTRVTAHVNHITAHSHGDS